jgi:hypothetical protein
MDTALGHLLRIRAARESAVASNHSWADRDTICATREQTGPLRREDRADTTECGSHSLWPFMVFNFGEVDLSYCCSVAVDQSHVHTSACAHVSMHFRSLVSAHAGTPGKLAAAELDD